MPATTKNLFFIDSHVADYETLIANLPIGSEWFLLNPEEEGIAQMAAVLSGYSGLDSIQIISHGSPGTLYLGSTRLNIDNLDNYRNPLAQIGRSLTEAGDILLYGCNVAQGEAGMAFINMLAQMTGADVAASIDPTGPGGLPGLEVQTGPITDNEMDLSVLIQDLSVNTAPNFLYPGTGTVTTNIGMGSNVYIHGSALQADGKVVLTGYTSDAGDYDFAVARYHSNGRLDTTFGGDGLVTTAFGTTRDYGIDVAMQADGKLVVAGVSGEWPAYNFALARYNADGSLDTSFSEDGKVVIDLGAGVDYGNSIAVQADGKILVGGESWLGGQSNFGLIRLNPDGSLDTGFDGDGKVSTDFNLSSDAGNSLVVQDDGKVIVAGYSDANGTTNFALARYNPDGSLDANFGAGGKVITAIGSGNESARSVTLQSDGKLLVTGNTVIGNNKDFAVIRYNLDGSLDTSFGDEGQVVIDTGSTSDDSYSVAVGADGKIWLAGDSNIANSAFWRYDDLTVIRLNSDGSLDTTFAGDGIVTTDIGESSDNGFRLLLQADGKAVVTGTSYNGSSLDLALVRYNLDGSLDRTFNATDFQGSMVTYIEDGSPVVLDSEVQVHDAELAAQGHYAGASLRLARLDGAHPDDRFSGTGIVAGQASGQVIVSDTLIGNYTWQNGSLTITFNADATQDRVNQAMQAIAYENVSDAPPASVELGWTFSDGNTGAQGSGGALTALGTTTVNMTAVNDAPTILSAGDLDPNFSGDGIVTTDFGNTLFSGYRVALQADGKILFTGTSFNGAQSNDFALVRYNVDGSLDTTFSEDGKLTTAIGNGATPDIGKDVAVQADGKIIVVGYSSYGSSGSDIALVRYNNDGSLDTTFSDDGKVTTDFGPISVNGKRVALQADGKILVAGGIWNGSQSYTDLALLRYNTDGSLDTRFSDDGWVTTDFGANVGGGYSIAIQSDGKILVTAGSNMVRYNTDGSLDTTFSGDGIVTTEFEGSIALQDDGQIVLGGYDGFGFLARYNTDGSLDTLFGVDGKLTLFDSSDVGGSSVSVQLDGKVLLAGSRSSNSNVSLDISLVRYNPDGSLDTYFSDDGKVVTAIGTTNSWGYSLVVQPDGNIVVAGASGADAINADFALARYIGASGVSLASSVEDAIPSTATVGSLFASVFADSDGDLFAGVVITADASSAGQGHWQYSTDLGAQWHHVSLVSDSALLLNLQSLQGSLEPPAGAVSSSAGLILSADTLIRFLPAANWSGIPGSLTAHVVDDSSPLTFTTGADRIVYDTTSDDLTAQVSDESTTLNTLIQAANDAPYPTAALPNQSGKGYTPVSFTLPNSLHETGQPFDIAINGRGFFQIQLPNGSTVYTRDGSFRLDSQGMLVTQNGYAVLPQIQIPLDALEINISQDGILTVIQPGLPPVAIELGQISLATFDNVGGLLNLGNNVYSETAASGQPQVNIPGTQGLGLLIQRFIETSSINFAEERVGMVFRDPDPGETLLYIAALEDGSALPDWLNFHPASGTFSGTPTNLDTGSFNIRVTAMDSSNASVSQTFSLQIEGNSHIDGTSMNDLFYGTSNADLLDGSLGQDTLIGDLGDDLYLVDNSGDIVIETSEQGSGVDTVHASLSWTLGANLEYLDLLGTGKISATGNALDNALTGNAAANILNGGRGADTLIGGTGNDTYVVDNINDVIQETGADTGDSVRSWVNWTLGDNLDNLTLLGTKSLDGSGNALNNSLTGNGAANVLDGATGNDRLDGASGNDTLTGGSGADTFAFTTPLNALRNIDTITDFISGTDKIELSSAIFKDIGFTGSPSSDVFFCSSSTAQDADDRILYDQSTGALTYDADGTGALAAVQFALLSSAPTLLYTDFVVG